MFEIYDIDSADVLTQNSEDIYPDKISFNYYSIPSVNDTIDYASFARSKFDLIHGQTVEQVLLTGELSGVYGLSDFVSISIIKEEGQIIGDIPSLELYAFGDSISEVISELKQDIIDLYEELESTPNKMLGPNPKKWKNELQMLVYRK